MRAAGAVILNTKNTKLAKGAKDHLAGGGVLARLAVLVFLVLEKQCPDGIRVGFFEALAS